MIDTMLGIHLNDRGTLSLFGKEYHWVTGYRLVPGKAGRDVGGDPEAIATSYARDLRAAQR